MDQEFELEKTYDSKKYEDQIYKNWESHKTFEANVNKDKKPFTISMPPPNATGVLHLGHATMLAIQDIMIRFNRMKGLESLWLPGTDHAAIATQSVVEKLLQSQGIANPRKELGRKKLLEEIRKFVETSKDQIRNQMRKMGASCDWSKEKYTLDESMNEAVNTLFQRMFEDKIIYRGGRIVNWDPKMQTTVADDELEYVEEKTNFYYFQYGPVVIGTARPETKFKDKIIVVNPKDKRYKDLIGKKFEVEWIEGKVMAEVIADECVDMELGTGAMTITPAHSAVDFELAQKYKLESPQIIDFEGKIRKDSSDEFGGMPIKEARAKIVEKLQKKGLVVKIDENYIHNISVSYRGKGIIEPQIMKQWFIDVNKKVIEWKGKKLSIKEVLQDTVKSKMININPKRFDKIYFHWIDNLKDWCISRQIWWGHQIPVWYEVSEQQLKAFESTPDASSFMLDQLAVNSEAQFGTKPPKDGHYLQDPDTLDTWFSSGIWTFATLGWPHHTPELKYFHPTDVLETGYDILFFWVARMILASTYALRKDGFSEDQSIPFKNVYLHGLIRDRNGKKMSKSNPETCIDPLDMIDKYGADSLRLSLVIGGTAGNDMRLYEEKIAGYRNFVNKIWNASRFAISNITPEDLKKDFTPDKVRSIGDKWILTELQSLIKEATKDLENQRFSDAGTKIYDFTWSKYCDWYLECSKGEKKNPEVLLYCLRSILKLLHPFVPFVTEKIWESITTEKLLILENWPTYAKELDFKKEHKQFEHIREIISRIRSIRAELKVEPGKKITAIITSGNHKKLIQENENELCRLARLEKIEYQESSKKIPQSKTFHIEDTEVQLPLNEMVDLEKEKAKLIKEIEKTKQEIQVIEGKLSNQGFVAKAPKELVEKEKERLEEEKKSLTKLSKQLSEL